MILKQLIKYDNAHAIEATWADENDVVIKCHAYSNHPEQIAMLRADLGADAADHEALIVEVEAAYVPPEPQPPQVPAVCTPAQGLVALFAIKQITEQDVATAIAAIPDPVQRYTAQIGFNRATAWERGSATMQAMSALLSLSETDLDALFSYAAEVQV